MELTFTPKVHKHCTYICRTPLGIRDDSIRHGQPLHAQIYRSAAQSVRLQVHGALGCSLPADAQSVPSKKGFQTTQKPSDATLRIFDFMVLVDFPGAPPSSRIKMPLKGKGCSARLAADVQVH